MAIITCIYIVSLRLATFSTFRELCIPRVFSCYAFQRSSQQGRESLRFGWELPDVQQKPRKYCLQKWRGSAIVGASIISERRLLVEAFGYPSVLYATRVAPVESIAIFPLHGGFKDVRMEGILSSTYKFSHHLRPRISILLPFRMFAFARPVWPWQPEHVSTVICSPVQSLEPCLFIPSSTHKVSGHESHVLR